MRPALLAVAVVVVYAASLRGGFLNYDDGWLVAENPVLERADAGALATIWTARDPQTRLALGAEYLPVRDTVAWLELRLFGVSGPAMRTALLALYVAAVLLMRVYLVRALPSAGELAAWLFALHPAHAENAAWIAGLKDVLVLLLLAGALCCYASERPARAWLAPLLIAAAVLSKVMAVVAPLLLLLHDLLTARRPRWAVLAATGAVTAALLVVHVVIGRAVGMIAPWPGGGPATRAATMGPVWVGYLQESFVPVGLNVDHEVPLRMPGDLLAWAGYALLVALGAAAAVAWRRGLRWPAWAWIWFVATMLPVSQLAAASQNLLMADRYLVLAVLGPCVVLAVALGRTRAHLVAAVVVALFGALTANRAWAFADSVRLWQDAVAKTSHSVRAPYQLAMALRERGRAAEAEAAFRLAMSRAGPSDGQGRAAANNLAALLAGQGRLADARALLNEAVARFPDDPKVLNNLAEITARMGDDAEARRLFGEVVRKFPSYEPGLRNYRKRYGEPPKP